MVNKALRIVLYSIFTISLFFVVPFNIYAETIDSHISGRNYTYEPITYNQIQVSSTTYYENIGVFHITFELDDEYIGYVLPNYTIQYDNYFYGASTPYWGTLTKSFDRRIFINGSSFSFDVTVNWNSMSINSAPSGDPFNYDSYIITSSDVTKYADIDSLDQIINILQNNQDIITDIYGELQTVVSNTSLANNYLDIISKVRQYDIPLESLSAVTQCFNYNNNPIDMYNYYYWNYPIFQVNNDDVLFKFYPWPGVRLIYIVLCRSTNENTFNNMFTLENGTLNKIEQISHIGFNYNNRWLIAHKIYINPQSSSLQVILKNKNSEYVIPIFLAQENRYSVTTDFALIYGLSNQLLDDIHLIADGTNDSSAASSQSDLANQQLQTDSNTLFTQEDTFKQDMNYAMHNIDTTFSLNNFGSSFMTSAQWVRTQYETLTNNTPFASLITFSLLVGLALIVIGKVYK